MPAVLLGDRFAHRLPVVWLHRAAALIFAAMGVTTLMRAGERFGC